MYVTLGHNLFSGTSGFQFHVANMDTEYLCGTSIQSSYTHTPKEESEIPHTGDPVSILPLCI